MFSLAVVCDHGARCATQWCIGKLFQSYEPHFRNGRGPCGGGLAGRDRQGKQPTQPQPSSSVADGFIYTTCTPCARHGSVSHSASLCSQTALALQQLLCFLPMLLFCGSVCSRGTEPYAQQHPPAMLHCMRAAEHGPPCPVPHPPPVHFTHLPRAPLMPPQHPPPTPHLTMLTHTPSPHTPHHRRWAVTCPLPPSAAPAWCAAAGPS